MDGHVLHVNNNLENQFSTRKKTFSIVAKPYFSSRAYCKLKTSVAASRNIARFSKRDMQLENDINSVWQFTAFPYI